MYLSGTPRFQALAGPGQLHRPVRISPASLPSALPSTPIPPRLRSSFPVYCPVPPFAQESIWPNEGNTADSSWLVWSLGPGSRAVGSPPRGWFFRLSGQYALPDLTHTVAVDLQQGQRPVACGLTLPTTCLCTTHKLRYFHGCKKSIELIFCDM